MLARHVGEKLLDAMQRQHDFTPDVLRVEIEENIGQSATFEWRP
jgi:hypothetical protein